MEDRILLLFSVGFTIWAIAAIVIPYVRRKTDLLTARNFFLAGGVLYVGFSGLNAVRTPHYFMYSSKVYFTYYLYVVVFFLAFEVAYKRLQWPRRWGAKSFLKWPPLDGAGLWFPISLALFAMAGQIVLIQVPGLRPLLVRVGLIAPAFAMAFALAIWNRSKMSPASLAILIVVFFAGAYLSFSSGGGRRFLYSLLIAAPVCFYWWYLRYRSPWLTLGLFAMLSLAAPVADSAYRAARWYGHFGAEAKRGDVGAQTRWQIFKQSLFSGSESFEQSTLQIGHNSVELMLLVTYIFREAPGQFAEFHVKPLHSLYVILTLPIPRPLWEDKPRQLGLTLPYDSKILKKETARTNWGPGIVAHGIHDGGILALILYAVLAGGAIRYLDEILVRNPGDPYLMGFLSAASVQIVGFTRGDIATMVPLTLLCFAVLVALLWAARMVLGTESNWRAPAFATFASGGRRPA